MQRKRPSALSPELIAAPIDCSTACKGVMPHGQQSRLPDNPQQDLPTHKLPVDEFPVVNAEPMTPQVQALLHDRYTVLPNRMIQEGWFQVCRGGCFRRTAFLATDRQRRQLPCCQECAHRHFSADAQLCYVNLPTRKQKKTNKMTPAQEIALRLMQAHVLAFVASDRKSSEAAVPEEQPADKYTANKHAVSIKRSRSVEKEVDSEQPVKKQARGPAVSEQQPSNTCATMEAEQRAALLKRNRVDDDTFGAKQPAHGVAPTSFTTYPIPPPGYMHGYTMYHQAPNTLQGIREKQAALMRTLHGVPKSSPIYLEMKAQAYRMWHELEAKFMALHEAWCAHHQMC